MVVIYGDTETIHEHKILTSTIVAALTNDGAHELRFVEILMICEASIIGCTLSVHGGLAIYVLL